MSIGARRSRSTGQITHRMSGRFSNLNIWDRYLTEDDLHKVYRSCDLNRGNVMYWCQNVIVPMLRNNVSIVSPSTGCSASCKCDRLSCWFFMGIDQCAVNTFDYSLSSKDLVLFQYATSFCAHLERMTSKYLLIIVFEVRTVSYGPNFFRPLGHKS